MSVPNQPEHQRNNFNFLRLFAACLVFTSHAFFIYGKHEPNLFSPPSADIKGISFGGLGVSIFFVISGYLICESRVRTPFLHFITKRVLRIYPAIFLNIILVSLVIAPLTSTFLFPEYVKTLFANSAWLFNGVLLFNYQGLPGVFTHNPVDLINGSLWTMPYEVRCYIIIALCGILGKNVKWITPVITLLLFAFKWKTICFPITVEEFGLVHCASFALGACYFLYKKYLPLNGIIALICCACLATLSVMNMYIMPLYLLLVAYITLTIALRLKYLGNIAKYGDFSYGLYIYAWPIQQTAAIFFDFKATMFPVYMATGFLVTLLFAVISWYAVERPALAFKARL